MVKRTGWPNTSQVGPRKTSETSNTLKCQSQLYDLAYKNSTKQTLTPCKLLAAVFISFRAKVYRNAKLTLRLDTALSRE